MNASRCPGPAWRHRPLAGGATAAGPATRGRLPCRGERDGGQITAFAVAMMAALILAAGLVIDGGLTLAARERALDEAQEAARAGAQAINLAIYRQNGTIVLDPGQAVADAQAYLAGTGDRATVRVAGDEVTVTVTRVQDMQILDAFGVAAITVHAAASAVPARGIVTELP